MGCFPQYAKEGYRGPYHKSCNETNLGNACRLGSEDVSKITTSKGSGFTRLLN